MRGPEPEWKRRARERLPALAYPIQPQQEGYEVARRIELQRDYFKLVMRERWDYFCTFRPNRVVDTRRTLKHFYNVVNKRFFSKRWRKGPDRVAFVAYVEPDQGKESVHVHFLMRFPVPLPDCKVRDLSQYLSHAIGNGADVHIEKIKCDTQVEVARYCGKLISEADWQPEQFYLSAQFN